jgi:aryl-alcohol dehydrogenase-like predicted oxidoreductase
MDEIGGLLELCHGLGVNLVDTAPAYGESEQRLGSFMNAHRDHIVLCTKCGEQYEGGRSLYDFSASAINASVENSLRRLRTDHIDLLLLHSNGEDLAILTQTDALEALSRLKTSGKIRLAGISAKTESGVRHAARTLDVIMAPFSQKEPQLGAALAAAHEQGVGVLGIKALFSGHLAARGAIEYVLRQEFIDSLILGTINPEHLKAAVMIAEEIRGH